MENAEIAQKLRILEKKTSDLLVDAAKNSAVAKFLKKTEEAIREAQKEVRKIDTGEDGFAPEFSSLAYGILSASPFTTKSHLCITFRVNESKINKWIVEYPEFKQCVEQGMLEGEILTRNMLVQASFEPSQKVNTNLMKILATNVYNIKDQHDVNLKTPEPLKFQIEVVSASKPENT